jgi:PPM family protein phosphatase
MTAAHVGNGRVYLIRDRSIVQLSKDHTVAAEAAEEGRPGHEDDQSLTRSLGRELLVPIDLFEIDLVAGDAVIVCTDGLYRALDDVDMLNIASGLDAATACRRLVDKANLIGTLDNLTVGVVRMLEGKSGERTGQVLRGPR